MPIFLFRIGLALHSDLQGEVNRLKRKNDDLHSQLNSRSAPFQKQLRARQTSERRARKKKEDCLDGHTRVEIAGIPQPKTNMHRIDLLDQETECENKRMKEANGPSKAKRKKGDGTTGEMGLVSVIVKLPGPKRRRETSDGAFPGGLEWDNRVLLNAVLLYVLSNTSLKEAGSAGMSFLSKLSLECFVKAEPRKGYQSRRIDKEKPLPVFNPISPGSVRSGVFALELAKNEELIKWLSKCDVINIGHDATSVGQWCLQCVYMRGLVRDFIFTDAAGTRKLGAIARSMCIDLTGMGDKFVTKYQVMGEDGKMRNTSITASDNFGRQLQQAGLWAIVTGHPAVTVISDGGGEGSGKGNRAVARQNMAGENSIGHQTFLARTAGDNGMKALNALGLWVPLLEGLGFDPLNGNISTMLPDAQRVNTVQRMLKEAMSKAGVEESESESDGGTISEGDEVSPPVDDGSDGSVTSPKPIYDPLRGIPAPDDQSMTLSEFVLWDIGSAHPELCLAATMRDVTEAMVAAVEELASIMRSEALSLPVDPEKCKTISIEGYKSLEKGRFVADDALDLLLKWLTHALGGRFVSKGGMFTTGPPVSPLIRSTEGSTEAYVVSSLNAARLENCVNRAETYHASNRCRSSENGRLKARKELAGMVGVFRSTRRQTDQNKVVFGPGSRVFVYTHLPGHYVSTEVANLGSSTEVGEDGGSSRNAVTITRADSNARNPVFSGRMHTALHITLRALGAIGTTQEVDHYCLPLPPQEKPDCAFYVLTRLESWLTGRFPPPEQWPFITRLLRCWTDFQAHRQLLHDGAIRDVLSSSKGKLLSWLSAQQQAIVPVAQVPVAQAAQAMPALQRQLAIPALPELWERAIAALPDAEKERRKSERKKKKKELLDAVLKEVSKLAEEAYEPEARIPPRQLNTSGPVMTSASPPLGAKDSWSRTYCDLVSGGGKRISMAKNPCRYFLMAERDKHGPPGETGGAGPIGASEASGEQAESSGANRGQRGWRRLFTNPYLLWCIRHRGELAAQEVFKRTDRFASRAERTLNNLRGPFVWPRANEHVRAYLGLPPPKGRDGVRPGPIHEAVQGAMKAQAETHGPPRGKMAVKLRIKSGKPATETEATPRSYHDRVMEEISETGRVKKPLACAKTRWGTRPKSFRWLDLFSRVMAAAYAHTHGEGREAALSETAKDVFHVHGWVENGNMRLPGPLGKHFHLLTNQTDCLMLSVGGFVDRIMVGPMMNAMSHNLESSSTSVCGIDSFFRRLLQFVKGNLFVGKFNTSDSYTGSDTAADFAANHGRLLSFKSYSYKGRKGGRLKLLEQRRKGLVEGVRPPALVRLAHRGFESLRGAHMENAFIINPSADVREVMGRFCSDSMVGCVTTLLEGLRRASLMGIDKPGKWTEILLYPTLEKQWGEEMAPHFKGKMGPEVDAVPVDAAGQKVWEATQSQRFQRNMIKAQWAVAQIIRHDMVEAIVKWFDNELYCILGFIACSLETRTVKARKEDDAARKVVDVLVANKFAVPNLVVAFRILDELKSHWPTECLSDFVPSQLGNLLRDGAALLQAEEFSKGEDIKGFVLVDKDGRDILNKDGKPMPVGPAPLERWEAVAALVHTIALHMRSNNDCERVFTHATRGFLRGGRNVTPMLISSWVRRKDWVSAGLWGKEKDPSFVKSFGKWRHFVAAHHHRMQRLSLPDVAGAEEKKMAAKQAKLALKYRRGEPFADSSIRPSNDFFLFGQKASGNDDADDAPTCRKRKSPGEMLLQKARAIRTRIKPAPKPCRKKPTAKKAKKATAPPAAAAAAVAKGNADSLCSDGDAADADGAAAGDDGGISGAAADGGISGAAAGDDGGISGAALVTDDAKSPDPASPRSDRDFSGGARAGGRLGAAGASGLGAQAGGAVLPRVEPAGSIKQHPSHNQVQKWLDSPEVKAARKEMHEKAKATRKAAASNLASACGLRSDAAATEEDENGSDSDEGIDEWAPSSLTFYSSEYIQVTLLTGGEAIRVFRKVVSGVALYHIYDHVTGGSQLVQIQSVWFDSQKRQWRMKYCRVYTTEMAITAAEQEDDKIVVLSGTGQTEKVVNQLGRVKLRNLAEKMTDKTLHHIGDVRRTLNPTDIVGMAAKLPATALAFDQSSLAASKEELRKTLASDYGVKNDEARRMAEDPIYIGDYFNEAGEAASEDDEGTSDSDSDKEECSAAAELIQRPSRKPLRNLRARVANGQHSVITDDLDDDDTPIFEAAKARLEQVGGGAGQGVAGAGAGAAGRVQEIGRAHV